MHRPKQGAQLLQQSNPRLQQLPVTAANRSCTQYNLFLQVVLSHNARETCGFLLRTLLLQRLPWCQEPLSFAFKRVSANAISNARSLQQTSTLSRTILFRTFANCHGHSRAYRGVFWSPRSEGVLKEKVEMCIKTAIHKNSTTKSGS